MRLTIVGSGTVAPHRSRVCAGHLVEAGAARILFDCGSGVVHRMASLELDWTAITHVAISHLHFDHVGDLPALISALRWGQMVPRTEPLAIIGPHGTMAWLERLSAAVGGWVVKPETYEIRVDEMAPRDQREIAPGLILSTHPVPHTDVSMAYSIASRRTRIVYTGDTGCDDALADWAAGCDALLTECSLPSAVAVPGHLTPELAGALAARARPAQLVLTHFYPPVELEDIPSLVKTRWTGPLVLAHDGTALDFED